MFLSHVHVPEFFEDQLPRRLEIHWRSLTHAIADHCRTTILVCSWHQLRIDIINPYKFFEKKKWHQAAAIWISQVVRNQTCTDCPDVPKFSGGGQSEFEVHPASTVANGSTDLSLHYIIFCFDTSLKFLSFLLLKDEKHYPSDVQECVNRIKYSFTIISKK